MGWKAKFVRRQGTQAMFFTRKKGEFGVDVNANAWPMIEALPDGAMVEVESQNYQIQSVRLLEDLPQTGGVTFTPPASSGGGPAPSYAKNPETEFKISFYASAKVIASLKAGQDVSIPQLALDAVVLMEQCELLMANKLAQPPARSQPPPGWDKPAPQQPMNDDIPF